MGLDAVVFKHVSRMDADVRRLGLLVDEKTGEVYLEQPVEGRDIAFKRRHGGGQAVGER